MSAYVLFIKSLRQMQKDGKAEEADKKTNFLSDASKQWGELEESEKKKFQDEALEQKQRYLEYKRLIKEQQTAHQNGDAGPEDDEELHQQRSKSVCLSLNLTNLVFDCLQGNLCSFL